MTDISRRTLITAVPVLGAATLITVPKAANAKPKVTQSNGVQRIGVRFEVRKKDWSAPDVAQVTDADHMWHKSVALLKQHFEANGLVPDYCRSAEVMIMDSDLKPWLGVPTPLDITTESLFNYQQGVVVAPQITRWIQVFSKKKATEVWLETFKAKADTARFIQIDVLTRPT